MSKVDHEGEAVQAGDAGVAPPATRVKWDTSALKSSYANFANANSTREEVVLNFGVNNDWDRALPEIQIRLEHRIMLSPFAAKRLTTMLGRLVAEYEGRYGELK